MGGASLCEAGPVEVPCAKQRISERWRRAKPADIVSPRSLRRDCRIVVAAAALAEDGVDLN